MAYKAPSIESSGIVIPTYNDIIEYMVEQTKKIYGNDIYLEEDSQDYQFLSLFSLLAYDVCQCLLLDYNSHNPTTAIGVSLDRVAAYCGISRTAGSSSTALIKCKGEPGTYVSYGSVQDENGYIWQLEKEFEIPESGEIEVLATCLEEGAIQAPIGTINKIKTPTSGWVSATNEYAASAGTEVETDSHLRARLNYSVSKSSSSILEGIVAEIQALDDILKIKVYENKTSDYDSLNIPPHSIAFVVEGGDENKIANAIFLKKTPGTNTYGTTTVTVTSEFGEELDIEFSRPTYKNVRIVVNATRLNSYVASIEDSIKENIVNEINNLDIGQPLYASNLYFPILSTITDITNPEFFINSVLVDEGQKVEATKFELIKTDKSLITLNIS